MHEFIKIDHEKIEIKSNYLNSDYHRMYIGEVINTLRKEKV